MKKLIVSGMCALMMLSLAACGETAPSTTEPSTVIPSNPVASSTAPHTHNFTSQQTKAPTCTVEGEMTFVCPCGEQYAEPIATTEHRMDEWIVTVFPTLTKNGQEDRYCLDCNYAESRATNVRTIEEEVTDYMMMVPSLPTFQSVDELYAGAMFTWMAFNVPTVFDDWDDETCLITRVYSMDDINKATLYYFGRTFDFLYLVEHNDDLHYDEAKNQLIWVTGGMGGGYSMTVESITKVDETHYTVRYAAMGMGEETIAYYGTIELVLVEGHLMFVSHSNER